MHRTILRALCAPSAGIFLAGLLGQGALAQVEAPPSDFAPFLADTGWVKPSNADGGGLDLAASFSVEQPGVDWLRVSFRDVVLAGDPLAGNGAELRIYSVQDGALQIMNAIELERWRGSTAYFNGDAVQIEVWAHGGTGTSRVQVDAIEFGLTPTSEGRSICGNIDDRQSSTDPRSGRLLPVGCTAWLIDDCAGCFLTAGHCTGNIQVVQFNVPLSTSSGSIQHPGPEDQYPVDASSVQSNGGQGVGNDWAYFGTFSNGTTGLTAIEAQGPGFTLSAPPSAGSATIRITGYGVTDPRDQFSQTQQTHTGGLVTSTSTTVQYTADTTGGNSGSPVIWDNTGLAVGIHTHGGCSASGGQNSGTSFSRPELQNALASPQGICAAGLQFVNAPTVLARGMATSVSVDSLGSATPGSVTLHYRASAGQGFAQVVMQPQGGAFVADLPGFDCGDTPQYFVSALTGACGQVFAPAGGPASPIEAAVGTEAIAFEDDFEQDSGWVAENLGASSGFWQRGVPVDDGGWAYDPSSDGDGSGRAYLTQNQAGNTDVDGGAVRLTSPVLGTAGAQMNLTYLYYLELTRTGAEDALLVEVSDGGAWSQVRRHDQSTGGGWTEASISAQELAAAGVAVGEDVLVRFTANDADTQSIVEAGVDGVRLAAVVCDPSGVGTSYCMANPNSTGSIGTLRGTGSASLAANDLVLVAEQLPSNQFALLIVSRTEGFAPLGLGNLCVAGDIGRDLGSLQDSGAAGSVARAVDWTAIPQPTGFVAASLGETWRFQVWHREVVSGFPTSNLTEGLAVTTVQ